MVRNGYRGKLLVAKAKAREVDPLEGATFYCWKCQFFSKDQNVFNNHMTLMHMMGVFNYQEMKRLEAVSTPSLLISTFHGTGNDDEIEEHQSDTENEHDEQLNTAFFSEPDSCGSHDSCISGVEPIQEANSETNEDLGNDYDHDTPAMDCSVTSLQNFVRRLQEPRAAENVGKSANQNITSRATLGRVQVDAEYVENSPSLDLTPENTRKNTRRAQSTVDADNVVHSPPPSSIQRYTSTGGIRNTPKRKNANSTIYIL